MAKDGPMTQPGSSPLPPAEPSPPQHATKSGSTTQSDRPREGRGQGDTNDNVAHGEDEERRDDDGSDDVDSSSLSSLSRTRTRVNLRDESAFPHDGNLDLVAARAVATWDEADLCPTLDLFADIHWAPVAKEAFLKLRTSVKLKNKRCRRHVFLFLYPERISSLSLDPLEPPSAASSSKASEDRDVGPHVFALRFDLSRRGALVLPSEPLEHKNKDSGDTLAALRRLAAQLSFTVRIRIPRRLLGMDNRMRRFCAEISQGGISSIRAHADTTGIYRGHGAQVIEGDSLEETAATALSAVDNELVDGNDDALSVPPAYEEAGPSMPSSSIRRGKKRRRVSSSASTQGPAVRVAELDQTPYGTLPASLKHLLTETLAAQERRFNEALAEKESRFRDELAAQRKELDNMRKDMDRQYDYIDDAVEEGLGKKMEHTQETIMRSITRGQLRATIYLDSPDRDLG